MKLTLNKYILSIFCLLNPSCREDKRDLKEENPELNQSILKEVDQYLNGNNQKNETGTVFLVDNKEQISTCSETNKGEIIYVKESNKLQLCLENKWENIKTQIGDISQYLEQKKIWNQIWKDNIESIFQIKSTYTDASQNICVTKAGTGFIVKKKISETNSNNIILYIATNHHIAPKKLEACTLNEIKVSRSSKTGIASKISFQTSHIDRQYADQEEKQDYDLILIKVEVENKDLNDFEEVLISTRNEAPDRTSPKQGVTLSENVLTIGYTKGTDYAHFSKGRINAIFQADSSFGIEHSKENILYEFNLISDQGGHEGPIFDSNGEVIAVLFTGDLTSTNDEFSYSFQAKHLAHLLALNRKWESLTEDQELVETSLESSYSLSINDNKVKENIPMGEVIGELSLSPAYKSKVIYSIEGDNNNDSEAFFIADGKVKSNRSFNYHEKSSYSFFIIAKDEEDELYLKKKIIVEVIENKVDQKEELLLVGEDSFGWYKVINNKLTQLHLENLGEAISSLAKSVLIDNTLYLFYTTENNKNIKYYSFYDNKTHDFINDNSKITDLDIFCSENNSKCYLAVSHYGKQAIFLYELIQNQNKSMTSNKIYSYSTNHYFWSVDFNTHKDKDYFLWSGSSANEKENNYALSTKVYDLKDIIQQGNSAKPELEFASKEWTTGVSSIVHNNIFYVATISNNSNINFIKNFDKNNKKIYKKTGVEPSNLYLSPFQNKIWAFTGHFKNFSQTGPDNDRIKIISEDGDTLDDLVFAEDVKNFAIHKLNGSIFLAAVLNSDFEFWQITPITNNSISHSQLTNTDNVPQNPKYAVMSPYFPKIPTCLELPEQAKCWKLEDKNISYDKDCLSLLNKIKKQDPNISLAIDENNQEECCYNSLHGFEKEKTDLFIYLTDYTQEKFKAKVKWNKSLKSIILKDKKTISSIPNNLNNSCVLDQ